MASKFPLLDQIGHKIGTRRMNKVLSAVFAREQKSNTWDEKDYDTRIKEVEARVHHRHAIILELLKFGRNDMLNEVLDALRFAEQEDFRELEFLIERCQMAHVRASEESRMLKKLSRL